MQRPVRNRKGQSRRRAFLRAPGGRRRRPKATRRRARRLRPWRGTEAIGTRAAADQAGRVGHHADDALRFGGKPGRQSRERRRRRRSTRRARRRESSREFRRARRSSVCGLTARNTTSACETTSLFSATIFAPGTSTPNCSRAASLGSLAVTAARCNELGIHETAGQCGGHSTGADESNLRR